MDKEIVSVRKMERKEKRHTKRKGWTEAYKRPMQMNNQNPFLHRLSLQGSDQVHTLIKHTVTLGKNLFIQMTVRHMGRIVPIQQ